MKLVIDISEEDYKKVSIIVDMGLGTNVDEAICNGTPLEDIRTDIHRHKMDFYPSDYTLINTLIDKWINRGVDV